MPQTCTRIATPGRLANGIQIFPGSVPIYRGTPLVGGIGVSGDGIDQDDMISFLGLHNGGVRLGTSAMPPPAIRADQIVVPVGERRRAAALRQLPVQPVPRHERAECLPGQMTVAAALLSLIALDSLASADRPSSRTPSGAAAAGGCPMPPAGALRRPPETPEEPDHRR